MSDYNNDDIKVTEDEQKYEDVCYMCRRPESKTGRMLHIPGMNNMCIALTVWSAASGSWMAATMQI